MGIPRSLEGHINSEDGQFIEDLKASFMPITRRQMGILHDISVANPDLNRPYPLESIKVPCLIIHAEDDPWGPFEKARAVAGRIPSARFLPIEAGGHLLLGHRAEVQASIANFVSEVSTPVKA
jgi:pimeloyl-ACP methyl ester carboxylesterase